MSSTEWLGPTIYCAKTNKNEVFCHLNKMKQTTCNTFLDMLLEYFWQGGLRTSGLNDTY